MGFSSKPRRSPEQLLASARAAAESERLRQVGLAGSLESHHARWFYFGGWRFALLAYVISTAAIHGGFQASELCTEALDLLWSKRGTPGS